MGMNLEGYIMDAPSFEASDKVLDRLDEVNSHGLVSKIFDNPDQDIENIKQIIEVHGTI